MRPTPCLWTNIPAAELSVHCWWVTLLQLKNSRQCLTKIASEHPDTIACSSFQRLIRIPLSEFGLGQRWHFHSPYVLRSLLICGVFWLPTNLHLYMFPATKKMFQLHVESSLSQTLGLKVSCPCCHWTWSIQWAAWVVEELEALGPPCMMIIPSQQTSRQLDFGQRKVASHWHFCKTCRLQLSVVSI